MNETPDPSARPLSGLRPPLSPPELRRRVLSAARAALLAEPVPKDRWTAAFSSRPLRLAWAACVVLLLLGHSVLEKPPHPAGAVPALPLARSVYDADTELAAVGRLPRLDTEARTLGAGPGRPPERVTPSGRDHEEDRT